MGCCFPGFAIENPTTDRGRHVVVSLLTLRGTHLRARMGLEPTSQHIAALMMAIHRIANRQVVDDWVLIGTLTLLQQLGLLSAFLRSCAKCAASLDLNDPCPADPPTGSDDRNSAHPRLRGRPTY